MANPIYVNSEWSGCSKDDLVFVGDDMHFFGTDAFADIQSAVNAADTNNSTINVLAGTYAGNVTLTENAVGEKKTNLTIKAAEAGVIVTGTIQIGKQGEGDWNGGTTIDGITFDSTNNTSIQTGVARHITIKNCSFNGASGNYMLNVASVKSGIFDVLVEDCDFGVGYVQIYSGNIDTETGRAVEFKGSTFNETTTNIQSGYRVVFDDCSFSKTLTDEEAAGNFYVIRSNDNAVVLTDVTFNIDSTTTAAGPVSGKDWGVLWQRSAGSTTWTASDVTVNYTAAAAANDGLNFNINDTTTAANAPARVTFENLTTGASSAADVDDLLDKTAGYLVVTTPTAAYLYDDGDVVASTGDTTLYADGSWAGKARGEAITLPDSTVVYYGFNAFSSILDAGNAAQPGVATTVHMSGNLDAKANISNGQNITFTGTAALNWKSDWFFVGRGISGADRDAVTYVTFRDATITSINPSTGFSSTGFHVSGYDSTSSSTNYGVLNIIDSTMECDYLLNRNEVNISNSDVTFVNMYTHGRSASQSKSGEDETASLNLTNGAHVTVTHNNGMPLGGEGKGLLTIDGSTFEHGDASNVFTVSAKGKIQMTGSSSLIAAKGIDNNGTITADGTATLDIPTLTGNDIGLTHGTSVTNSTVGGGVELLGEVSFVGNNRVTMVYDFGKYTGEQTGHDTKLIVGAGNSLTMTSTSRYGIGYGDAIDIDGAIVDALTARAKLTESDASLTINGGMALQNGGWSYVSTMTVDNAYVILAKNNGYISTNTTKGGNYNFTFTNSVVDATRIHAQAAGSYVNITFSGSDVKFSGVYNIASTGSTTTLTNTVMTVNGTNGNDQKNTNAGTFTMTGSTVTFADAFTNTGNITIAADSLFTGTAINNANGTITINAAALTANTTKKVIDLSQTAELANVALTAESIAKGVRLVKGADGDVAVTNVSVDKVYVNSAWAGSAAGAEVAKGKYYGINAFDKVATAYAALSSDGTIHLEDGTSTYELGTKIQIKDGKGFTITGNAAPVDIRTVSMDEDTGDLYVISTDSKNNTKTVLFSGTVIPIFTLGGKDDEPDFANIPDSTMNVTNAQFGIAELDARPNGTVNVTNSTLTDHGGNSIIKSYFNGAINVTSSNLEAMQVTTTGYITLNDGAILLDTWQTNLYDNGIITLNAGATFYTSKMTIGHTYNRVNPDAARVGKPATLDVNGGTLEGLPTTHAYHYNTTDFFVGKDAAGLFLIRNGGTATLTHGSGLQIMAQGTMSLTNGTLTVLTVTGSGSNEYAGKIRNAGTITLDVDSSITATELINSGDGSITVDATAALAANTVKKVIDLSQTASLKDLVTVNLGTSGSKVAYGADGDVVIHNISVDNVYVNSDWATGYSVGDEIVLADSTKVYYGINAFSTMLDATTTVTANEGGTITIEKIKKSAVDVNSKFTAAGNYKITGGNTTDDPAMALYLNGEENFTVENAIFTTGKIRAGKTDAEVYVHSNLTITDSIIGAVTKDGAGGGWETFYDTSISVSNSIWGAKLDASYYANVTTMPRGAADTKAAVAAGTLNYVGYGSSINGQNFGTLRDATITDSTMATGFFDVRGRGLITLNNSLVYVGGSMSAGSGIGGGNWTWGNDYTPVAGYRDGEVATITVGNGSIIRNVGYGNGNEGKGIQIGTSGVAGAINVTNGSQVLMAVDGVNQESEDIKITLGSLNITDNSEVTGRNITNAGTITIDATSSLTAEASITNTNAINITVGGTITAASIDNSAEGASITIDATTALAANTVKKVIDLSQTASLEDQVTVDLGTSGSKVAYGADGDVVIHNISAANLYVNAAWATGYSLGDEITLADSTKVYYGINAFSNIDSLFALYGDKDHRNTETTEVVFLSDVTATATGKQFFFSDVDVAFTAASGARVDMTSYTRAYLMGYYEVTNFSGQPTSVPTFTIGDNVTFVAKTLMAGQAIDNPDDVDAQGDATRAPGAANVIVNGTIEAGQTYAAAFSNISTGMSGVITTAGVNDNEMVIRSQSTITVTGDGNHTKTQFSPQWVSNQGGTLTLKDTVGDTGTVKTLDNVKDLYPGNSLITVDNTNLTTYALDLQDVQGELQLVNGSALANSTSASNSGTITVDATSAITTAGAFANHGAINITVGGTVTAKSFTNDGMITIDVTGISGSAADVITVTSETGSAIDKDGVTLIGTDADKFAVILKDNGGVSVARVGEDVYIWNGCAGLATGTPVSVNGTEAFVGIDAFATLDKALTTVGKTIYFKSNDAPALAITGHLNGSSLLKASDAEADVTVAMGSSVSAANNMLTGDLTIGEGVTFAATKLVHRNTAEKTTITVEGTFQSVTNAYLYAGVMDVAETGKLTGDDVFLNGSGGTYELNVNGNDNKPEQVDVTSLRIGASATANFTDTIVSAGSLSVTAATGKVNASNTTINGDVSNAGTFNADEATINGDVSNAGTINLAAGSTLVSDTITNVGTINGNSGAIEADSIINGASDGSVKGTITAATLNASSIVNNNGAAKKGGSSIELTGDLVAGDIVNGVEPIVPGTDEPKDKALIKAANITADSITNFGTVGSQTSELEHTLGTIELDGGLDNGLYGNVMADNLNAASLDNHNEVLVNNINIGGVINNYAGAAIALNNGEGSTGHIVINAASVSNAGYIKTLSGGSINVTGNLFNDTYAELTDDEKLNKVALEKGLIETDSIEAGTVTNNGKIDVKVSMGIEGSVTNNASGTINLGSGATLDAASVSNAGRINVAGTLDAAAVENNGTIALGDGATFTGDVVSTDTIEVTGTVTVTGAITNNATGTITIDAASSLLSATSIANEGTITIDTTGFTGIKKIIDLDGENQTITGEGTIEVDGARLVYHGEDSSYYLTNVDQSVLYVSNDWSTASYGEEVENGKFYGINAFSALQGTKGALAVAMPRTADTTITFEGTSFSEAYDDDIMANFSGKVVFNGSPVTLNQTAPDARMDLCVSPAAGTTATISTPITAASSDSLAGIWLNFTGEGTTKVSSTITAKTYIGINSNVDVDKDATLTTEADLQIGRAKDAIATNATITGTGRTFGADEYQVSAQGIQLNEGTATVTGSKVKANTLSVTDTFAFNAGTGAYTGAVTLNSTKTTWDLASIIVGFYTAEAIGGYLTPGASTFNFKDSVINVGAIKNQAYFIPGADGQIDETTAIEGYALTINLDGTTLEAASILNNGTIALTNSSTATVTGAITGTGTITVDASTLSFGGDFAAGTLTLSNGGTVAAISGDRELTIGTLTGTITVNADADLTGSVVGGTGNIAVSDAVTLTLDGKTDETSFGAVTNAGTIDIEGALVNLGAISNDADINMTWRDLLTFSGYEGTGLINIDMTGYNGVEVDTKVLNCEGEAAMDYQAMTGFDADYFNRYFKVGDNDNDLYLKGGVSDTVYVHDGMSIADAVGQAIEQSAIRIVVEDGTFSAPADFGPVITKNSPYYDFTDNMFTGYEVVINDGTFFDDASTTPNRITGGAVIELTGKRQYVITGGDRSVTINGGEFNGVVVGGDRLTTVGNLTHGNNDDQEEGVEVFNASLSLEINGGVFNKNVAGGMMLDIKSDDASVDQYGDINLTINGGTFVKFIYGGNVSSNRGFSSHITVTGDITVTIDTTAGETISINSLYAGSFGDGKVNGSTKVVLTGDGQYLSVADQLWGGCTSDVYIINSDGTKTANSKVTGTRTLSFEGFTGDLNVKSIKMFSDIKFDADSDVNFANFGGTLAEVENWEIAFGSEITGAFNNDFAGDSLNLTGLTGELEEDWVIFDDASKFKNITEEGAGFATINGSAAVLSDNLLEGEICGYDFGSYTLAFTEASDTTSAQMVLRNAVLS